MADDVRWARIQMWKPVREVWQAADELFAEAERLRGAAETEVVATPPAGTPLAATPPAGAPIAARGRLASSPPLVPPPVPPSPGAPAGYLRRRAAVRDTIDGALDPVLTEQLGPWQKHVCITVIASFIDERERIALGALAERWRLPLLQTELVGIDDGGDRCFAQLHELLARADVHELVFEIHLLCLRAGFVGRYAGRRHELDKLAGWVVDRLRYHLPRRAAPPRAPELSPPRRRVGFIQFPLRYYVAAVVVAGCVLVALRLVSNREVARSSLAEYCHYHDRGDAP